MSDHGFTSFVSGGGHRHDDDSRHHDEHLWSHGDAVEQGDGLTERVTFGAADEASDASVLRIDPLRIDDALDLAIARAAFDPQTDDLCSGWLSDLQGITAEYLVADALNNAGDGLSYHLYTDLSHPDADIAGVAADGTIVRLLQVKATSDPYYAETGRHPGVEVVATSDGAGPGMISMGYSAAELRAQIDELLSG